MPTDSPETPPKQLDGPDIPGFLQRLPAPAQEDSSKPDATRYKSGCSSWRVDLPIHPAADLFPLMAETDPAALKVLGADIKQNGLASPIVLWSDGKSPAQLLDGRNRLDAIEIAIGPVIIGAPSLTAGEHFLAINKVITLDRSVDPYAYVISANIHRRHLTAEKKRELIADLLKANPARSNNATAKIVKVDDKTVATVRADLEGRSEIPNVSIRTDSQGRGQPAKKPKTKSAGSSPTSSSPTSSAASRTEAQALERCEAQAETTQSVGAHSGGEVERFRVRIGELESEIQRLRKENEELRGTHTQRLLKLPKPERVASLKQLLVDVGVAAAELAAAADPPPHPLDIPPALRRANPTTNQPAPQTSTTKDIPRRAIHDELDELFRDYRKLPLADLEERILTIKRTAGCGVHLSPKQWGILDGMRKRAAELGQTALTLVHNAAAVA